MSDKNQDSYKFNEFRLDVGERLLLRDNLSVPLTPKVFDVLALLVKRGGYLVEKDEFLRIVWQDAFVEESTVARAVHTLRKVLGEDGENKFIETVPKKGYRFVAAVEKIEYPIPLPNDFATETSIFPTENNGNSFLQNGADLIVAENQNGKGKYKVIDEVSSEKVSLDQTPAQHFGKQNSRFWVFGTLFLIAFLAAGFWLYESFSTTNEHKENKSIAVLPFKPINNENHDPIYELGIAESLIWKLSSAKELTVRPLSATQKYLDLEQNPNDAGREQKVDFVLSSNYQISGGKILITSQFINTQTGAVEEVFKSEKDLADVFLMEDAVVNDIGNPLLARFGNGENNLITKRDTDNKEAYRLYLQAAYIFEEWNEPEIGKAIKNLEQAVTLDPNYAQAYVQLAYAYQSYQFSPRADIAPESVYYLKPKKAIEKALALDENSADAHAVLGFIKSGYERDFAGAEKEYQRAIELDSRSGMAHGLYASYLMILGRYDEALTEEKKAIEIDPTYVVNYIAYGMILHFARRYPEASAYFKKMLEKYGGDYFPYNWLWIVNDAQGNEAEAYEWFIKDQTHSKTDAERIRLFQTAYKQFSWKGILREKIRQDEQILITDKNPFYLYEIACFSAKLGNKDKAFEYLDKSYEQQRSTLNFIKVDPSLDSLHGDPRFDELVKRIGLK